MAKNRIRTSLIKGGLDRKTQELNVNLSVTKVDLALEPFSASEKTAKLIQKRISEHGC